MLALFFLRAVTIEAAVRERRPDLKIEINRPGLLADKAIASPKKSRGR